jgi:hypothetical protein
MGGFHPNRANIKSNSKVRNKCSSVIVMGANQQGILTTIPYDFQLK